MLLASASNDIKIIRFPELEILRSFAPHSHSTNVVSWNCDNQILASSGAECDIQLHRDVADGDQSTIFANNEKYNIIRFCNKSSRLLGMSSETGLTVLLDTTKMVPIKTFKSTSTKPLSMAFSQDDSVISIGCDSGHLGKGICMYDLNKESNFNTMEFIDLPNFEGASKIEYSYYIKEAMACGSGFGNIHLIDTVMAKVVHKFEASVECPCAELSYSPINDVLLASLNRNGQLGLYDVTSKSIIKSVETGSKSNCMKILEDGTTLIIGTDGGRLEIFDLRAKFVCINTIKIHTLGIKSLSVQKMPLKPVKIGKAKKKAVTLNDFESVNALKHGSSKELGSSAEGLMDIGHGKSDIHRTNNLKRIKSENNKEESIAVNELEVAAIKMEDSSSVRSIHKTDDRVVDNRETSELKLLFEDSVGHILRDFKEDMHADLKQMYSLMINQFFDIKTHLKTNSDLTARLTNLEIENKELKAVINQLKLFRNRGA